MIRFLVELHNQLSLTEVMFVPYIWTPSISMTRRLPSLIVCIGTLYLFSGMLTIYLVKSGQKKADLPSTKILYGKRLGHSLYTPSHHFTNPYQYMGCDWILRSTIYHDRTNCPFSILADIQHILSSNDPAVEISDDDTLVIDRRLNDFLLQFQV